MSKLLVCKNELSIQNKISGFHPGAVCKALEKVRKTFEVLLKGSMWICDRQHVRRIDRKLKNKEAWKHPKNTPESSPAKTKIAYKPPRTL